jgi:hypothetical protein
VADPNSYGFGYDPFGTGIPQLLPKFDGSQNMLTQPGVGVPVGFGTGAGLAGGIVGTAVGNPLVNSAIDAARLPGDVYQGNVDLSSPAGFGRAQNMAGMLMGGGMPMAEAGAVGSAGGRLFHGSPQAGLTELMPSSRGPLGPGVYATPAEQIAGHYANGGPVYQISNENLDVYRGAGHRTDAEYFGWKDDKQRLMNTVEPSKRDEVLPLIDKMWSSDGYPLYQRLARIYGSEEAAQNLFKRAGFEGLSGLVDGPETLIFGKVPVSP